MKKEIRMINKFNVFELKHIWFKFDNDWQYVPLHWVFAVKHDLRHKERLVIGGHVTDATGYDRYAATIRTEIIRLQIYLAAWEGNQIIGGDIGSAYLNAYTEEKIWIRLGPEFGDELAGRKVRVLKSLYGLCASENTFYKHLCDTLRSLKFKQCKMD